MTMTPEERIRDAYEQAAKVCDEMIAELGRVVPASDEHAKRLVGSSGTLGNVAARIRALSPAASTPPLATVEPGREWKPLPPDAAPPGGDAMVAWLAKALDEYEGILAFVGDAERLRLTYASAQRRSFAGSAHRPPRRRA